MSRPLYTKSLPYRRDPSVEAIDGEAGKTTLYLSDNEKLLSTLCGCHLTQGGLVEQWKNTLRLASSRSPEEEADADVEENTTPMQMPGAIGRFEIVAQREVKRGQADRQAYSAPWPMEGLIDISILPATTNRSQTVAVEMLDAENKVSIQLGSLLDAKRAIENLGRVSAPKAARSIVGVRCYSFQTVEMSKGEVSSWSADVLVGRYPRYADMIRKHMGSMSATEEVLDMTVGGEDSV